MSVYKRPGKAFYSYDFVYKRQRFSGPTGCETKRKAERFEEQERARVKSLAIVTEKPITIAEAAALYHEQVGVHLVGMKDALRAMEWLEEAIGPSTLLSAIDGSVVARIVAKRRGESIRDQRKTKKDRKEVRRVSPSTVNRTVTIPLRALLRIAERDWNQTVCKIKWKDYLLKEPQERVREANSAEQAALDAATRSDYKAALRFSFLTGCRRAEVVGLTWAKVDWFNKEFTVTGKGDKSRTIPMTAAVHSLLWSLKNDHPTAVFTYIVRRPRKGQIKGQRSPITMEGFKTHWRRSRKRADVHDFRFHDTRHTAATRLVRATGNLKMVQKLLGHSDIATTARYAHVTNEDLRAGLEASSPTELPTEDASVVDKALKE